MAKAVGIGRTALYDRATKQPGKDWQLIAELKAGRTYQFYDKPGAAKAVLIVGFDDFNEHHRDKAIKKVQKLAVKQGAVCATGAGIKALELEAARDVVRYTAMPDHAGQYSPDVFGRFFVPKLQFDAFSKALEQLESKLHVDLPLSGWALAGSYAVHPVLDLSKTSDKQKLFKLLDELAKLITAHQGAFITDGGEGKLKAKFAEQARDPAITKLYQEIKQVCDPHGILAPGVKVNTDLRSVVGLLKA